MSVEIKVNFNPNFFKKTSPQQYKNMESHIVDKFAGHCLHYIVQGGIGYRNPSGGAPIFQEEHFKTTVYPGYLANSHYTDLSNSTTKYIKSFATYWKSVVNGYRPDTTPYGYSYRHGGIPYVANPYHKRAIDNAISSQIIQKYTAEFMQKFL